MKNLSKLLILAILAPCALAQVPAPQVPITGNMGPGGVFPLLNSGTLHFTTDANHTMTYPEMSANVIRVVSNVTLTEQRNLVAPLTLGFQFTVQNATTGGQSIQVIGATGTGVIIANGTTVSVACDGTNYVQVGVSGVGTVTSFASPSASWPSWLVPSVSNPNTTPSLSVAASTIPVASGGTGTATPNLVAGPAISISGSWPNQTVTNTQPNIYYSVLAYGAVPDEQPVGYARFSTSSGSNVVNLTSIIGPSYNFSGADVGKSFVCNNNASAPWTGGAPYVATITTVNNATQIVISTPAGNMNTSSPYCVWGTDNTPAFNACETAVAAMGGGGTCSEPSGRYLFATSPYYTFVGTALDDGGYATPAGGSGAVVTATVSGGAISGYTVSNGGSGYPINSQMQMTFTGGCPVVYAGPCGEAFAIANTNGSGVVSSITPVFNGFGFTSPPTVGVVALGGDGASATCTLSSGTCGTPSIGASGSGYTPSSSSLEIWAFNAVGGTCTEIGGRTGSRYVGKGNATTNSSGAVIGASWTTAPASCGSTTPTIAFGDVACWNAAMSQFNAQCTNLTPLLPTAIPVQVYTEPHVSWIGPTAGQNPAASNIGNWDGQTVDAVTPGTLLKQPAMFGGPMFFEDFYGLQNTNTFIGLLSSYDWDYSTISNMTFSGGLGFVSSSADTSAVIQDMNFQGYASWVNGGRWGHRTDDGTREAGGFFEPSYVNNFTVIPVGGGGYDSVAAAIDTWFADAFWRPEFTANAVDMPETCAFPQTANQRQTSSSLSSPIGQANETCYKGITGTGMVNLARDNNPIPAPVSITNFTVKKLWRPMFYGPINNNTLEFFSSEASTTLASDPYRAEVIQEGGIEFASTGAFSTVANISYYLSSGSAVLPIYNMDSATTTGTAGLPTGTAWWNLSGTSFTGTMPEQSLNIQNVIQNPNGELFSYNGYNSSSACFANWTNTAAQYAAGCLHGDGLFSHSFSAYGYTGTELMRFDPSDVQLLSTIFAPNIAASSGTNCLQIDTTGHITNTGSACSGGGGTVNSVNASDSSLTIFPNSGTVEARCTAASNSQLGCVQPDGTTTTIVGGKLVASGGSSYTLPIATTSTLGGIKPDGTTIITNSTTGVTSAVSSGGAVFSVNQQTGNVLTGAYPAPHTVVYVFGDSTNLVSSTCQFGGSGTPGPPTGLTITGNDLFTFTQNNDEVAGNIHILQGLPSPYTAANGQNITVLAAGLSTTAWAGYYMGLVPIMTSDTLPSSVIVSADNEYFPAYYALNPTYAGTGWQSNNPTGWLQIQLLLPLGATPPTATTYFVSPSPYGGDNPTAWQFEGSNNGSSWTVLDTETGVTTQTLFTVTSPGAYSFYRLNITANGGGGRVGVSQFMLNPPANGTPSISGVTNACRYILPSVIQYSPLMQAAGVTVVDNAAPGDTAANEVANFATNILPLTPAGGATTPVTIIYRFTQDVASCNSVEAVEATHAALWTLTYNAGAKFIDTTITPYGGSIYCYVDGHAAQVNKWMRSQTQQVNTLGGILDEIHGPVNDFNDPDYYIQGGLDEHHPTDAWAEAVGEIIINSVLTGGNYIAPESGVGVTVSSSLNTSESVGATKTFWDSNTQMGVKPGTCIDPSGTIGYACFATINYNGVPNGGFSFIPNALANLNGGSNNGDQLIFTGFNSGGTPLGQYCFAGSGYYGVRAIACLSFNDSINTWTLDTTTGYGGNANLLANNVTIQGALISAGTKFTVAGTCSVSATTGGASAGTMTLGANTCTATITFGLTTPHGWSCHANDETTAAGNALLYFLANSPTTATLSVPATAGTTDVIDFACTAF